MILGQVFTAEKVIINLKSSDKDSVFEEMVSVLAEKTPGLDRLQALDAIKERESKMTTGIMHDVAIPHGRCMTADGVSGVIGISKEGIEYGSLDKSPVHYVFMLMCGIQDAEKHLEVLKSLSAVLQKPDFIKELSQLSSPEKVMELLLKYEEGTEK